MCPLWKNMLPMVTVPVGLPPPIVGAVGLLLLLEQPTAAAAAINNHCNCMRMNNSPHRYGYSRPCR